MSLEAILEAIVEEGTETGLEGAINTSINALSSFCAAALDLGPKGKGELHDKIVRAVASMHEAAEAAPKEKE